MGPVTKEQVEKFKDAVAAHSNNIISARHPGSTPAVFSVEYGRRYAKITRSDGKPIHPSMSVWGFVDLTNGDILKAESWRKPAMHARGSLHSKDMDVPKMKEYGPPYLR